jgi:hypothetical protein
MENWLYEEGEDCNRQIYVDKLSSLKVSWCCFSYCVCNNNTTSAWVFIQ